MDMHRLARRNVRLSSLGQRFNLMAIQRRKSSGLRGPNPEQSKACRERWADPEWRAKTTEAVRAGMKRRTERGETLAEAASRLKVWDDDQFETKEEAGRYVRKMVDGMSEVELNALSQKGRI